MDLPVKPIIPVDTSLLARKGEQIYQNELTEKLEKEHIGRFVAIEVESKEYFLGDNQIDALTLARKKFPTKVFYLVKIGFPAVVTMSRRFTPTSYGSIF